jgi:putative transposase
LRWSDPERTRTDGASYRVNGELRASALVTPHDSYIALGAAAGQRATAYRRLFAFDLDEEDLKAIRSAANGGFALGNQRFKDEIAAMLGRRVDRLRQRLGQRASQPG